MKKIISILLCVCMTVGIMSAAFAADTDEMKKVLETVKSRIGSTDEYDKFESRTYTDEETDVTEYYFSWKDTKNNRNLEIAATGEGVIRRFDRYGDGLAESVPISKRATKAELKAAAEGFIRQLNPDIAEDITVGEMNIWPNSARADVKEYKNGYPIFGSYGNIEIDLSGKQLRHFGIYSNVGKKFETGDVISKEEAVKIFKEKLGAELYYSVDYERKNNDEPERKITPMYRVKNSDKYISAVSGEIVEPSSYFFYYNEMGGKGSATADAAAEEYKLSEAEIGEIGNVEKLIAPEKAFEIVKKIKCADFPNIKFEEVSKSLGKSYNDGRIYRFHYYKDGDKISTVFVATVNAQSGEVLSFNSHTYSYGEKNEKEQKIPDDKAETIAGNAIKELAPEKYSEYKLESVTDGYCQYVRYVNEIPVESDSIYVLLDPETEKVSSYSINYIDVEFPDVSKAISKSEAEDIFIKEVGYGIEYIYDGDSREYKLCYTVSDTDAEIDPFTGAVKTDEATVIEGYSDISGHYAENAVNTLAESDIGFAGSELRPDEPIKQKEFAYLINQTVKNSSNYAIISDDTDIDSFMNYVDFIAPEELNPEGNVTRRDAAKFTVRAMGYIDVAKLDIFKPIFNDMAEDVGYASILAGLKILNGDGNGNFNPEGVLTRAQALIIIYNYLNR